MLDANSNHYGIEKFQYAVKWVNSVQSKQSNKSNPGILSKGLIVAIGTINQSHLNSMC